MGKNAKVSTILFFIIFFFQVPKPTLTCEIVLLKIETENGIVAELLFNSNFKSPINSSNENYTQDLMIMTTNENSTLSRKSEILKRNELNIYPIVGYEHPNASVQINIDRLGRFKTSGNVYENKILRQGEIKCIFANSTSSSSRIHQANGQTNIEMLPFAKVFPALTLLGHHSSDSEITNIVVEVLVMLDQRNSYVFHEDKQLIEFYVSVFYNSVNNRFRSILNPKITIVVTGIIIFNATYGQDIMAGSYHHTEALTKLSDFVKQNHQSLPKHDVVQLLSPQIYDGETVLGVAYLKGACSYGGVSIVTDRGGVFEGVYIATHELAHLIGATHDGEEDNCSDGDHIMSASTFYDGHGMKERFYFSNCSIADMKSFINSNESGCLRSLQSSSFYSYPPVLLSGDVLDLDQQCKTRLGRNDVEVDRESLSEKQICTTLRCRIIKVPFTDHNQTAVEAPADNSPCGLNKVCFNGECVLKSEKIDWKFPYFDTNNLDSWGKLVCILSFFIFMFSCVNYFHSTFT